MGLETKEMEVGKLYKILDHWYIIKYNENSFLGNNAFVYGFNDNNQIIYVSYGKLENSLDEYNNSEFLIRGWALNKNTCNEDNSFQMGNPNTAKVFHYADVDIRELEEDEEREITGEIGKFWINTIEYFNRVRQMDDDIDFRENYTVDGFDPIDWSKVIQNEVNSGRKHR